MIQMIYFINSTNGFPQDIHQGQVGIWATHSVTTPANGEGLFGYLQLVDDTLRRWTKEDNSRWKKAGTNLLDSILGVIVQGETLIENGTPIGGADTKTGWFADSPAFGLSGNKAVAIPTDIFTGYLMYRPVGTESIWVTLREVSWSWSGAATKATNGVWNLDSGYPTPPIDPVSEDSTRLPTWNGIANRLPDQPDN